ncbi:hypothetical protein [Micromonospora sp. KC723]|uniref:hypothetical protein n=1 Tax=Micromonospora sp. KC723 TaxID=2530381 RepID=UPI001FB7AED6|nr:hypothetical protein [Micromonospora sp. KC723]
MLRSRRWSFEIPSSLDGLDLDALTQLENQAVEVFDALRDDPDLDGTGLARLQELATFVTSVARCIPLSARANDSTG